MLPRSTEIEATYRVVTPLFCGGADQQPEVRLASFKGVLRFWWRAAAWARHGGALARVRAEEAALFGQAADGKGHGQSRVQLSMPETSRGKGEKDADCALHLNNPRRRSGLHYLAYGMLPQRKDGSDGQRKCLFPPVTFTVRARYRPSTKTSDDKASRHVASLRVALETVGLVGGLGARSRKGFGSLMLTELKIDNQPQPLPVDPDALVGGAAYVTGSSGLSSYTAFTGEAEHLVVRAGHRGKDEERDSLSQLGALGRLFKDHLDDASVTAPGGQARLRRAAFGLPRHVGAEGEKSMAPAGGSHDRRASPLFIHVHEFEEYRPAVVLSFLPAQFLPGGSAVSVGAQRHPVPPEEELYRPVREFLDRLRDASEWTVLADTREQEGAR